MSTAWRLNPKWDGRRPGSTRTDRKELGGRIDQLIGWAKAGRVRSDGAECYLMDAENVDRLRDDVLNLLVDDAGTDG